MYNVTVIGLFLLDPTVKSVNSLSFSGEDSDTTFIALVAAGYVSLLRQTLAKCPVF